MKTSTNSAKKVFFPYYFIRREIRIFATKKSDENIVMEVNEQKINETRLFELFTWARNIWANAADQNKTVWESNDFRY